VKQLAILFVGAQALAPRHRSIDVAGPAISVPFDLHNKEEAHPQSNGGVFCDYILEWQIVAV
jgi:hypothetical protein